MHLLLELLGIHRASGRLGVNRVAGAAGGRLRRKLLHWRVSQHSRLQTRRRLLDLTRNTGKDLSLLIRRDHRGRPDHPCTAWTHHDASASAATGHGAEPGLKMSWMICLSWATGVRLLLLDTGMTRGLGNQLHRQLAVLRLLISGGRGRDRDTAPLNGHLLMLQPLLHFLRNVGMLLLLLLVGVHLLLDGAVFWGRILLREQLGTLLLLLLGDRVTEVGVSDRPRRRLRMRDDPSGEGIGIVLLEVRLARPVELLLLLLLLLLLH